MKRKLISIVVPAFNEEGNLHDLKNEIEAALRPGDHDWELIIVDDGSTDGTAEAIAELAESDHRVNGIFMARNFGHQNALLAGLDEATGDAVVTIDADLEQPPSVIPQMIDLWEKGNQVVHSVRKDHPDTPFIKRVTSRWFYRVFSFLSRIPMEPGMLDFRLLDRKVVDAVLSMPEADFFLRGIATWIGYRQTRTPYQAGLRRSGKTKYSMGKMIGFAARGITSFSTFPLRLATYIGIAMTLFSLGYGAYVGVRHFFWEHPQPGYASTILLIALLMGIQFLLIGVLGEYVARIHVEVKRRPRYVVANRTRSQRGEQSTSSKSQKTDLPHPKPAQKELREEKRTGDDVCH